MNKSKLLAIALIASTSLTGCAGMFNGTSQQVSIRSNEPDTTFYVNEAYLGKDNAVTTFKKKKDYTIRAEKKGCESTSIDAQKSFDPTTLLGILIDWGIFSILLIDGAATGAWQQFDQESYVIDAVCPSNGTTTVLQPIGNV